MNTYGPSDEAVKKATGKTWQQWFDIFDRQYMQDTPHKDIVIWLDTQKLIDSSWWRQSVTVGYEYHIGRRVKGQTMDVGFEVGVQKTIDISPEAAWRLITSSSGLAVWLGESDFTFETGSTYTTLKGVTGQLRILQEGTKLRMTWQPNDWPTPSTLQVYLMPNGRKTSIRFHHDKLSGTKQRNEMQQHWKKVLVELEKLASE